MDHGFQERMRRVAALTRQGDLGEATRLIQAGLTRPGPTEPDAAGSTQQKPKRLVGKGKPAKAAEASPSKAKPMRPGPTVTPKAAAGLWKRSRPVPRMKQPVGTPPAVAPGARYAWHIHQDGAGLRRYRLYTPAALVDAPEGAPLLLMLHGCTQDPDDFARGTRMNALAERFGCLIAYPEQTRAANAMACWNWFQPGHQARGMGEPESLAGIARAVVATHELDPTRVFAAGLSAGGAMAAVLAETHGDVFAAVGVHSGLPYGAARDVGSAQAAMASGSVASRGSRRGETSARTIVVHGTADRTVHPANGEAVFEAARGHHAVIEARDGGAAIRRAQDERGRVVAEHWRVDGLGHAWSGGDPAGSHSSAQGPDASEAMLRFFLGGPS